MAVATVVAVPSTSSVVVTWGAFAAPAPVTYTATLVGGTGTGACAAIAATTCTFTAITPTNTDLTVSVQAFSIAVATGTPGISNTFQVGAPAVPTSPVASANSTGDIDVSWTTPVTLGAGIQHYLVTGTPGGTCTGTSGDATASTCAVPAASLTPGTSYTFTVRSVGTSNGSQATNDSAESAASASVVATLAAPRTPSTNLVAGGAVAVTWLAPLSPTGVTSYTATTSPGGKSCTTTLLTCTIPATGLAPGVAYAVNVRSNGAAGAHSVMVSSSLPAILGPLNPPTNVMATGGNGTAMVSWTAPTGFTTLPLNPSVGYYTVTGSHGDVCNTPDYNATTCTVTGLANFTSSTFTVVAHSTDPNIADSPASAASAPVTSLPAAITLKSQVNGKYVTAESAGSAPLIANRTAADTYEKFWVVQNSDGSISLKSAANGKYVTANPNGTTPLIANRTAIDSWEKFGLVSDGGLMFTLMAMSNGKYVSADQAGALSLVADRSVIGTWETFALAAAS